MPDHKRGAKKTEEDLAFNSVVGRNLKYLRKYRKLNQTKVAKHCKVKFQQLQKYEKGINGCSAFRLNQLAKFFKVSMDVLIDPEMITKHRGFASYQDRIDAEIEIDKMLTEQDIIDNYKRSVGHKCP
jgi:transcriptional regulator with XRE-family HTH domain